MEPQPQPQFRGPSTPTAQTQAQYQLAQQQTLPRPAIAMPFAPDAVSATPSAFSTVSKRRKFTRIVAIALTLVLAIALFFIWHSPTQANSTLGITQQNFSGASSGGGDSTDATTGGEIQVYVVGAIKHPGVYTLPADARVFQLLQAAGGALPNANLVALNLAATLSDGEEVYVVAVGEIPPTYMGGVPGPGASGTLTPGAGQLVNINTASTDELRQQLHVSSTTAQAIVNYRLQHGPYTSIDQLLQVISKSIYDRIKGMVTI